MLTIKNIVLLLFLAFVSTLFSQTQLPSFFSDNMVLQRNENVSIWGHDNPEVKIKVTGSWGNEASVLSDKSGGWCLKLQTPDAGGPYDVVINGSKIITIKDVLIGEVWLCSGQSNMSMPLKGFHNGSSPINGAKETIKDSENDQIRLFNAELQASLEPLDDISGEWLKAEPSTVIDFSALAYYFGAKLQKVLGVPIGLIQTSWGGSSVEAWMDKQTLSGFDGIKIPDQMPKINANKAPSLLNNGMLNPFIPFSIKGVIWYQGEDNVDRASTYKNLFQAMIQSWRKKWKKNMSFYFVQIAPFGYKKENSAFLRESQLKVMQTTENTGMAVTQDIGDCSNIHPAEKKLVGDRLSYWALAKDYGKDQVVYSGPIYKSIVGKSDGKIKLVFEFNKGLWFNGQTSIGFQIAGKDKVFYQAQAVINKDQTIDVWSERVKNPVAVRYAFDNCTEGTLFNQANLPASSFRTDNWNNK